MEYYPLVSIIVVTYNSAPYVIRTLESIRAQTYRNFELIVTDDASTDDTVSLCKQWLNENGGAFIRSKIITGSANSGLVENFNSGFQASGGEWVKFIAGDDELMDTCIEDNVRYVSTHNESCVVFSGMCKIDDNGRPLGEYPLPLGFFSGDSRLKLIKILHHCSLQAPSAFFNSAILRAVGGFDPAYPMMEDFPMWVKLLTLNYEFGVFQKRTVRYRVHGGSLSGSKKLNPLYVKSCRDFNYKVRLPLAKELSPALHTIIRMDVVIFYIQQHYSFVIKAIYPLLWIWARYRNGFNPEGIMRKS